MVDIDSMQVLLWRKKNVIFMNEIHFDMTINGWQNQLQVTYTYIHLQRTLHMVRIYKTKLKYMKLYSVNFKRIEESLSVRLKKIGS